MPLPKHVDIPGDHSDCTDYRCTVTQGTAPCCGGPTLCLACVRDEEEDMRRFYEYEAETFGRGWGHRP